MVNFIQQIRCENCGEMIDDGEDCDCSSIAILKRDCSKRCDLCPDREKCHEERLIEMEEIEYKKVIQEYMLDRGYNLED